MHILFQLIVLFYIIRNRIIPLLYLPNTLTLLCYNIQETLYNKDVTLREFLFIYIPTISYTAYLHRLHQMVQ